MQHLEAWSYTPGSYGPDYLEAITLARPGDAPFQLARLRAETGLRLPDCCVLLSASGEGGLATFDQRWQRLPLSAATWC